jgi:hypothetical protein
MKPNEKAEELVLNFSIVETSHFNENMDGLMTMAQIGYYSAKQCALIAVDEIIAQIEPSVSMDVISARIKYWEQVKQEIEKL